MSARGPYDTHHQADQDAARFRAANHTGRLLPIDRVHRERGIVTSTYDHAVTEWLTHQDPATVAVILGWIEQAHDAGKRAASASPISFGGPE